MAGPPPSLTSSRFTGLGRPCVLVMGELLMDTTCCFDEKTSPTGQQSLDWQNARRRLMKGAFAALAGSLFAPTALARAGERDFWSLPRHLWLRRHTSNGVEEFKGVYFANGQLLMEPYVQICRLMRDVREDAAVQMSPVLLDILCGLQGIARVQGVDEPLITTSGHRSRRTNSRIEGAARNSLHVQGRAWDGRMPGMSSSGMAEAAKYLQGGGVGLYVQREFVHIDDGRLRSWTGR